MLIATVLLAGTAFSALGCGEAARIHTPPAPSFESAEVGLASWYGHPYHGRRAANGEIYNMNKLTAAHRSLPFGTLVRVRNLKNGRAVVVRITDRGPFPQGRIIDLSRTAARVVGMLKAGLMRVQVEILAAPAITSVTSCAMQEGAFKTSSDMVRLRPQNERRSGGTAPIPLEGSAVAWRIQPGLPARPKVAGQLEHQMRIQEGDRRRENLLVSLDQ